MPFSKTILALVLGSIAIGTIAAPTDSDKAKKTNSEKAKETVKAQEIKAKSMMGKYGQDLDALIPESKKEKPQGHTTGSFIDKQSDQFKKIEKDLREKGMLDGFNEDGNAKHIEQKLPKNFMQDQKQKLDSYVNEFNRTGALDGFDEKTIAERTEKYRNAAQLIANDSQRGMITSLQEELGLSLATEQNPAFDPNRLDEPTQLKAVFVSFNMTMADLQETLRIAATAGAQVYFKGMHEDDNGIQDTIRRLRFIGRDLDINPDVRFKPRYFDEFNISQAPTILVRNEHGVLYASGITNFNWLQNKIKRDDTEGYLGSYGETAAVTEKDIREVFKERMAGMNLEEKQKEVVDNYWTKKDFVTLPPAIKNDSWYIDPTVRANKDIINPRGDQLAKEGQVINPLSQAQVPLTLYIFDPTDSKQLEWIANNSRNDSGEIMLIFSQLDKERGWKHLESLRTYFGAELYQLPKEMVSRFNLTNLPVKVSTDLKRKLLHVEQFDTRNQEEG